MWKILIKHPLARLAGSALALAAIFQFFPLGEFLEGIRKVHPLGFGALVLLFLGVHFLGGTKWCLLIGAPKNLSAYFFALRCYYCGLFANLFLPSAVGGDVVRALMIIKRNGQRNTIVGSLMDRALDTVSLLCLPLAAALMIPRVASPEEAFFLAVVCGTMLAAAFAGILLALLKESLLPAALKKPLAKVKELLHFLYQQKRNALIAMTIALVMQIAFVAMNIYLAKVVGIDVPVAVWFFAWPLAKLFAMMPLTLGGLGVREAALAVILSRFDVPMAQAVTVGLAWQSVVYSGGLVGGLLHLFPTSESQQTESAGKALQTS